jgi:hypothetical protein
LDSLATKGLAAYLIATRLSVRVRPVKRTYKHHDIDPLAYLQDVLRRLPSHPADRLGELLPDVWFASHPSARRKTAA